jgi:hypothetical protein
VIDEFMGHQTEAMRKRYRHLFSKDRRSAIESFSLAANVSPSSPLCLPEAILFDIGESRRVTAEVP